MTGVVLNAGVGGVTLEADAVVSSYFQVNKLAFGVSGTGTYVESSVGRALPVSVIGNLSVTVGNSTLTVVQATATNLKVDLSGTAANATPINVSLTGPVSIVGAFSTSLSGPVSIVGNVGVSVVAGVSIINGTITANAGSGTFQTSVVGPISITGTVQTSIVGGVSVLNGSITVTQATASNLKVDLSGTAANATPINVSVAAGVSVINGTITANAGSGNFQVSVVAPISITGNLSVVPFAKNSGGYTPYANAAVSGALISVFSGANTVGGWFIYNQNAAAVYLQFFDTNSITIGTTAPTFSIGIPASSGANLLDGIGIAMTSKLNIAATTSMTNGTSVTIPLNVNLFYKS